MKRLFSLMLSLNFLLPMGAYANTSSLSDEKIQVIAQEMDRLEGSNLDEVEIMETMEQLNDNNVTSEDLIDFITLNKSIEEVAEIRSEVAKNAKVMSSVTSSSEMELVLAQLNQNTATGSSFLGLEAANGVCRAANLLLIPALYLVIFYPKLDEVGASHGAYSLKANINDRTQSIAELEEDRVRFINAGIPASNEIILGIDNDLSQARLELNDLNAEFSIMQENIDNERERNEATREDNSKKQRLGLLLAIPAGLCKLRPKN